MSITCTDPTQRPRGLVDFPGFQWVPRAALGCLLEVLRVARKEGTLKPLTSLPFYRSKVLKAALTPINIGRLGLFKSRALLRMSSAFIFIERCSLIILIQNCLFNWGRK